jgi:hypothetical protein
MALSREPEEPSEEFGEHCVKLLEEDRPRAGGKNGLSNVAKSSRP